VHESDDFWRENASKLNEKDYEQLKLVSCLMLAPDWALTTLSLGSLSAYWARRIHSCSLLQCTTSDSMSNTTNEGRSKSGPLRISLTRSTSDF
jgi:hypothetical protein